jgi:NADP-dependent 3-hydroxy acid dehydrogenase YdfG
MSTTITSRVILITGCSSGFGRAFAQYFLSHGQKVVVTARKTDAIQDFAEKFPATSLVLPLDVNDENSVNSVISKTLETFGQVDVLINNAGYSLFGVFESYSEAEYRLQMETNFFGAMRVTQAVLPIMRKQKSGHVIQISSVGGVVANPMISVYNASKFALEGFTEALAKETAAFNVKFTIVQPGGFKTDIATKNLVTPSSTEDIAEYAAVVDAMKKFQEYLQNPPGDPNKAAAAVLQVIQSPNPPLRLPLGADSVHMIKEKLDQQLKEIQAWEQLAVSTNFDQVKA